MKTEHKDVLIYTLAGACFALAVGNLMLGSARLDRGIQNRPVPGIGVDQTNTVYETRVVTNTVYFRGLWTGYTTNVVIVATNYVTEQRGLFLVPKPEPGLRTLEDPK